MKFVFRIVVLLPYLVVKVGTTSIDQIQNNLVFQNMNLNTFTGLFNDLLSYSDTCVECRPQLFLIVRNILL